MRSKWKAWLSTATILGTLVASQVAFVTPASAAEGDAVHLNMYVGAYMQSAGPGAELTRAYAHICTGGEGSLEQIVFDSQTTNIDITSFTVQEFQVDNNNATDLGSVSNEGVWTGQLDAGQCLAFDPVGTYTGVLGESASWTISIVSSTLVGGEVNVDPDLANDTDSFSIVLAQSSDLAIYLGMGGEAGPVWEGFDYDSHWTNICSSDDSYGVIKTLDLDITSVNWTNVNIHVQDYPWSNTDVDDPGSIDGDGNWTGQLQPGACLTIAMDATVSGALGDTAQWYATINGSTFVDDTINVDPQSNNDSTSLLQEITEPVEAVDLNMYVGNNNIAFPFGGQFSNTWGHICTSGYGTVSSITFDIETSNWNMTDFNSQQISDTGNNATDPGSVSNGVWTGLLEAGQCLVLNGNGPVTGNVGDTVSWTISILSSTLVGGALNNEPNLTNQTMAISGPIAETGDLAIQTRLMTSGEITDGTTVDYEVEIQNIGAGPIFDSQIGLYYVLPEGATLMGVTDSNPDDGLSVSGCQSMGPIGDLGPAFSAYEGEVIQCLLQGPEEGIPAGSSYPFVFQLEATQGFATGATEVFGVVLTGNISEPDSYAFVYEFTNGRDGFALPINNIMHLTYDANELQVTINRCDGYAQEVTIDDACFTVEFSKPVWAASFDVNDLVIEGGGHVTSFEMVNNTKWTVHISGMTPGGTIRLFLGTASVTDYSAVLNGTSVLGENIIRFVTLDENQASNLATAITETAATLESGTLTGLSAGSTSSDDQLVLLTKTPINLETVSGLVSEIPDIFKDKIENATLLLGSWSITRSNVLDFAFIIINFTGLTAMILILKNRRQKLA